MEKPLAIVYYIWINPQRNWEVIIRGQLTDIIESGVLEKSDLHVVLCCPYDDLFQESVDVVKNALESVQQSYDLVTVTVGNFFEFPGILTLYDLAQKEREKTYLYMHSKGMYNWWDNCYRHTRIPSEIILTRGHLNVWREIASIPSGTQFKAGMFPGNDNSMLFNFFWATGEYLASCSYPVISEYRYYYETWLGSGILEDVKTWNIQEEGRIYTSDEAVRIIKGMNPEDYKIQG
jgi:hypothetical protein